MTQLRAAISSDIDTLASIYKGQGCRRAEGYTFAELHIGLENFSRFLEPYTAKATLFMVGNDFLYARNHSFIREMTAQGHEIANHTMSHPQGFRLLSLEQKEAEIAGMERLCEEITGKRPIGFRSPGWNISDDAISVLLKRGYHYDSSIFPTFLMPLLKFLHWFTMRRRSPEDRTTLGQPKYMFAPLEPYHTNRKSLAEIGRDGIVEFPITVTPIIRLPVFATFLLATGFETFVRSYRAIRSAGRTLQFQFHLSDFVDYNDPLLANQVPEPGGGQYVPQALYMPLKQKVDMFRRVIDVIAQDFTFTTLGEWADDVRKASADAETS